jgi:hypothetical protein
MPAAKRAGAASRRLLELVLAIVKGFDSIGAFSYTVKRKPVAGALALFSI